ncbi:hypothetical protein [Methylobacterium sp. A52T]
MRISKIACLTAVLGLVSDMAFAQPQASQENLKRHCIGDYLEHCGQFSPDGGEVQACFRERAGLLTPNCSMAIAAYQEEQKAANPIRKVRAAR